jgi:hypothetical protein
MKQIEFTEIEDQKSATDFINEIRKVDRMKREELTLSTLMGGHVPSHMKFYTDIVQTFKDTTGQVRTLVLSVLPDFLSIGNDVDYVRVPMNPLTAQRLCDTWGCTMPTTKISNIIWGASTYKLQPLPWGPPYDASMMSVDRLVAHNGRIQAQVKKINDFDPYKIMAGHKKDVVVTNKLEKQQKQVAIYGWHQLDGKPIQPLYLGHENTYADYSHGIRLVSLSCVLDDVPTNLQDIFMDENLCHAVSDEGKMISLKQPGVLFDKLVK